MDKFNTENKIKNQEIIKWINTNMHKLPYYLIMI